MEQVLIIVIIILAVFLYRPDLVCSPCQRKKRSSFDNTFLLNQLTRGAIDPDIINQINMNQLGGNNMDALRNANLGLVARGVY